MVPNNTFLFMIILRALRPKLYATNATVSSPPPCFSPFTALASASSSASASPSSTRKLPSLTPVVISGPSGVGKGTLCKLLLARHPDTFCISISHTTRDPRPGEKRDVDYHYVSMSEFVNMIEEGEFVEHAKFSGNRYGTSKDMIERLMNGGKCVLLDIEMEGVKQIHACPMDARYAFIAPPSMDVLEQRLRGRGTEKEESIQKRLVQAKNEIEYSRTKGAHDIIIVNDDLEAAYRELEAWIFC